MELGKPRIGLIFISRDLSYGTRAHEWTGQTKDYEPFILAEEVNLLLCWKEYQEGKLPPCNPRLYDGKECSYCNFKTYCGGGIKK
jgi:hypothetical protein